MTFRLLAPQATEVSLRGTDIPGNMRGIAMTKGDEGVWSATVGPLDAGAYRYNFNVGGVSVIDPRNPSTSESNNNTWSLVVVPGSDEFDTKTGSARRRGVRDVLLDGARALQADARLHAARIRDRSAEISRVLSAARRGRLG